MKIGATLAKIQLSLPLGRKNHRKDKKIQNDAFQIANIILFELCRCDAEILRLIAAVYTIRQYSCKGAYVMRAAVSPDFPLRVYYI